MGLITQRNGESRSLLAAQHPAEEGASFDVLWRKKTLTYVCHLALSVEARGDGDLQETECENNPVKQRWHVPKRRDRYLYGCFVNSVEAVIYY